MAEHYFTAGPTSDEARADFEFAYRGRTFRFTSAAGVFARRGVDRGSRLLLDALPLPLAGRLLDLGCGYGVLGIVATALSPGVDLTMVDINARAVALAAHNAEQNGVGARVLRSDGFAALAGERFEAIVCNPPIRAGNQVVDALLAGGAAHLAAGGRLYFVAQTKQGGRSTAERAARAYRDVREVEKGGGFRVYCALGDGARADA